MRFALLALVVLQVAVVSPGDGRAAAPTVIFHPDRLAVGDLGWLEVHGTGAETVVQGVLGDRPLVFFPRGRGHAALIGVDLETPPGPVTWTVVVVKTGQEEPRVATGMLEVHSREFAVQRLTVPPSKADPDPATARRALEEGERLRTLYRTLTPERFWRGPFVRPLAGDFPGTGFGARRIINGKPRMPHAGLDFAAPWGTPVVATNSGRVALVGEFFYPGRLVVIDHGLELYTLYFHLDTVGVIEGDRVERGQPIGTVGATGRATGPHLHFGAQLGSARVDPAALFRLAVENPRESPETRSDNPVVRAVPRLR